MTQETRDNVNLAATCLFREYHVLCSGRGGSRDRQRSSLETQPYWVITNMTTKLTPYPTSVVAQLPPSLLVDGPPRDHHWMLC